MQTQLNAYLHFKDNTREAMEFYKTVFGGKLTMNTYKEFNASDDPSEDNKIMHAMLEGDNGIVLMAADTPNRMEYKEGARITLSLSGEDEKALQGYWDELVEGARIDQPLTKAQWGDTFGMLTDKYGIEWMVNITAPKQ